MSCAILKYISKCHNNCNSKKYIIGKCGCAQKEIVGISNSFTERVFKPFTKFTDTTPLNIMLDLQPFIVDLLQCTQVLITFLLIPASSNRNIPQVQLQLIS